MEPSQLELLLLLDWLVVARFGLVSRETHIYHAHAKWMRERETKTNLPAHTSNCCRRRRRCCVASDMQHDVAPTQSAQPIHKRLLSPSSSLRFSPTTPVATIPADNISRTAGPEPHRTQHQTKVQAQPSSQTIVSRQTIQNVQNVRAATLSLSP